MKTGLNFIELFFAPEDADGFESLREPPMFEFYDSAHKSPWISNLFCGLFASVNGLHPNIGRD